MGVIRGGTGILPVKTGWRPVPLGAVMAEFQTGKRTRCEIEVPKATCLVIFGASGDLARRKLIPSLYRLFRHRRLPRNFSVCGLGRTPIHPNRFRNLAGRAAKQAFPESFDDSSWKEFASKMEYSTFEYSDRESYVRLGEKLLSVEKKYHTKNNRVFYLAIPPSVYETVVRHLGALNLSREAIGYSRIVIEKPFGRDLASAKALNATLRDSFEEEQIYRIDHYVAKETVQSILMFRFANSIFEPLWNNRYIDHIQITSSETLGVEHRAGYYEKAGVLRDMFQNHMLQLLALTAMEPPDSTEAERVRDERVKVLRSIRPFPPERLDECLVMGQYGKGRIRGRRVEGYREEEGVSKDSTTATFAAMKVFVDNWRWNGVPFYLRSGKRMSDRKIEVSIHFKPIPHSMFTGMIEGAVDPNVLVFRIQPDEGISLNFQTKEPGSKICLKPVLMDFSYQQEVLLDAYEWVLLDCMLGDSTLFMREDSVEQAWSLLTPVIEKLESTTEVDTFPNYEAGSSGPREAGLLIERDGRKWRPL
jgi:glucose-6-phosphate 1-dehydrogenase